MVVPGGLRLAPPQFPTDDVDVAVPPAVPQVHGGPAILLPLTGVVAMAGMGLLAWSSGSGVPHSPTSLMFPAMMLVSAIGMFAQTASRRGAAELDDHRRRYLDHLGSIADQLTHAAALQHDSLTWVHPPPSALWTLIGGRRMSERGRDDSDFAHVRLGVGGQRLGRQIRTPALPPAHRLDPVSVAALRRLVQTHTVLDAAPVALALRGVPAVVVAGDPDSARDLLRAVICQLAVLHSATDVRIVAVVGGLGRQHWDWLKWLPHNDNPQTGPMVYDTVGQAETALGEVLAGRGRFDTAAAPAHPHVVVIVDGVDPAGETLLGDLVGVTVLSVGQEALAGDAMLLRIDDDRVAVRTGSGAEEIGVIDRLASADALVCARRLARYRYRGGGPESNPLQRWCAELGIAAPDGPVLWPAREGRERLRVPIGTTAQGRLVELDIKEAAEGGLGPHGLCVGATGSGKSELLRTVVLGMISRHPPEDLNLVLVDFKGGATFLGLEGLHHVAAVITNLSEESHLVDRMKDALGGEIHRRQQFLRRAGNIAGLAAYRRLRRDDDTLPPLPSLFVVIDEFAELLHYHPDFAELFVTIGRVGRSLGVHLLLASQRLDEGRLRGLDSHLSYRICLKTLTGAESRAVLGVADAAELPGAPGAALLRTSDGTLTRFQTIYVGAADPRAPQRRPDPAAPRVRAFTSVPTPVATETGDPTPTLTDTIVERFSGLGARAHPLWLPPLPLSPELAELAPIPAHELAAPIGLIDLPFEQRRTPLLVDIGGAAGNIAVVGAPRTGKSATARTIVTALAARHDARRIQWYCLDFGGGTLHSLLSLAHVGSVAARGDRELVRRIVGRVESIVDSRDRGVATDPYGDVVLVVDGWAAFREDFGALESTVTAIATQGLSYGVHVLITAGRWADIRPGLKDQIGTRIELRLGDPVDSEMDRRQAALVPAHRPGSGITRDGHHFVVARSHPGTVVRDGSWTAPPVRLLPDTIDHDMVLREAGADSAPVILGIGEADLEPVTVDFTKHAHLLIFGDSDCGKTATLRTLCHEVMRGAMSRPARLFVIDLRRSLVNAVPREHLAGYAGTAASLAEQLPGLVALLESRLSASDTTAEWSGPQIFVIVDDYDLVTATSPEAMSSLLPLLPYAVDIGVHVVLARRCSGSARAMFEPMLAQLRDSGCTGLLMNGSPEEGCLVGNRRAADYPAGRGLLVTRGGAQVVQVGWCPP